MFGGLQADSCREQSHSIADALLSTVLCCGYTGSAAGRSGEQQGWGCGAHKPWCPWFVVPTARLAYWLHSHTQPCLLSEVAQCLEGLQEEMLGGVGHRKLVGAPIARSRLAIPGSV